MSNDITIDVGETVIVEFDFAKELRNKWQADYQYALTEFIQIGAYEYECTNAGITGHEIPENLTTTIAATQIDGTVEWTCRDYGTSGTDTISTQTCTASDAGITVDSSAIEKNLYVTCTFTGVTAGSRSIVCEIVTVGGETIRATYNVFIY